MKVMMNSFVAPQKIQHAAQYRGNEKIHSSCRSTRVVVPRASMGIGFTHGDENSGLLLPKRPELDIQPEFGLSVAQMRILGLSNESMSSLPQVGDAVCVWILVVCFVLYHHHSFTDSLRHQYHSLTTPNLPLLQSSLTAKAFYCGDEVDETKRQAVRMAVDTKAPGQAPPDLPSLLLDGRICYIGMPFVPSVTELIISELLWLNYAAPDKPIYLYINSTGSQNMAGEAVGFETEATAILDTMAYIRPDIYSLVIGQAFGNAAMLLASGKKGHRFALPNARIMTCPPRMNRSFGNTSNVMIKANELENATQTYVHFMSKFTGRDKEEVRHDIGRNRYFTPEQAIEYGIIDGVVKPTDAVAIEKRDYEGMMRASQAGGRSGGGGRGARSGGGMAAADA